MSVTEQKTIGITLGTDGTYNNTVFTNNSIQLTKLPNGDYSSNGYWESEIVDIGDRFKEFGNLVLNSTITSNELIKSYTKTSSDGITFSSYQEVSADGKINSPSAQYIQIKLELLAGFDSSYYDNNSIITDNNVTVINETSSISIVPVLTNDNRTNFGFPFTSSRNGSANYFPYQAFNTTTYEYRSVNNAITASIGYYFERPITLSEYVIRPFISTTIPNLPSSWDLEASNNTTNGIDGTWTLIDSQRNVSYILNQNNSYLVNSGISYHAYRIVMKSKVNNAQVFYSMQSLYFYEKAESYLTYENKKTVSSEGNDNIFTSPIINDSLLDIRNINTNVKYTNNYTTTWANIIMTSNTAPAPYVITASTSLNTNYAPWKAYNGVYTSGLDRWFTASNNKEGNITIDLGNSRIFNTLRLSTAGMGANTPTTIIVLASDTGITFDEVAQLSYKKEMDTVAGYTFIFENNNSYRYYRLFVKDTLSSTATYTGLTSIFWGQTYIPELSNVLKVNDKYYISDNSSTSPFKVSEINESDIVNLTKSSITDLFSPIPIKNTSISSEVEFSNNVYLFKKNININDYLNLTKITKGGE